MDYNSTSGNTTTFGAGSYQIDATNYIASANSIGLNDASQVVVLNHPDSDGSINVIAAQPIANIAEQYTGSVADLVGSIIALDIQRPDSGFGFDTSTHLLSYSGEAKQEPALRVVRQFGEGNALDSHGNLFWARVFGGLRDYSGSSSTYDSSIYNYGFITGVDHVFDRGRFGTVCWRGWRRRRSE
ncbi:hypothetical protein [uncultured Cohaesibacter sp.]|uniref:hypothetical protein n=1 Tax=uncultured Cohaesibacter sp. TaxID=1002546 RepID=UPI0029C98BEB|nr:hypothetical protein [uncultured Cohaesibacter sp.]